MGLTAAEREYQRSWMREWRAANPEKSKAASRRFYAVHKSERQAEARERARVKRARNPIAARELSAKSREKHWAAKAVYDAQRRGRVCTITAADLESLWRGQGGICAWTGVPLSLKAHDPCRVSVDRIDNARGYVPENVVLVTWFANRARMKLPVPEFLALLGAVRCPSLVEIVR